MLLRILLVITSIFFIARISAASIVGRYSKQTWLISAPTRVIIASKGLMFSLVGYQQAQIFKDLFPEEQILFVTNQPKTPAYAQTKQIELKRIGFSIVEESMEVLNNKKLIAILKQSSSNIKSLDIISHNGIDLGPWLEDESTRLDFKNQALMASLKPLFASDAWARIQGCNSGWKVAPALSKVWGIPVLGSFTSTSFYTLTNNRTYEIYSEDNANIVAIDEWSYRQPLACSDPACAALRPEGAPYHFAVHRSPEAAWLPFLKPVCDAAISDRQCRKALVQALLTTSGAENRFAARTDLEIFKQIAFKSICGAYSASAQQQACIGYVRDSYEQHKSYFPYKRGTMLNCSGLRACQFKQVSKDLRKNLVLVSEPQTILEYLDNAMLGFSESAE